MDIKFTFVNSPKTLIEACKILEKEDVLGIDLECENNLHYYGVRLALIQISSKRHNFIIDPVALKDIKPFIEILENKNIVKIFHDVSFDFRMLNLEYKCVPKNIFDTQMAMAFLGYTQLGLGELLEKHCSIKKESKFQMANWIKRPISEEMLEYAIHDTLHLIELREILIDELKRENKLSWVNEELKNLEYKDWTYHQGEFFDMRGVKQLTDKERSIGYELYKLRERLAERVNRPIHFILSNKRLIELAIKPYRTVKEWENINGVHPIVKQCAKEFLICVLKGEKIELPIKTEKRKRYTQEQIEKFTELNDLKEKLSKEYKLPKHLIMNKEQEKEVVLNGNLNSLSHWQKEIVEKEMK